MIVFVHENRGVGLTKNDHNHAIQFFMISGSWIILLLWHLLITPTDFATPIEEAVVIMDRVRLFLEDDDIDHISLPWDTLKATDWRSKERGAKIKAIEEHLGVFPDGSDVPLTTRQRIFFRDPMSRLKYKIQKARRECGEIVEVVKSFHSWEGDIKNTRLIRHFVLECLSPFKRFTLNLTNATYDEYPSVKPSWPVYIGSWIFISGTLIFCIYWIFDWGVYQGQDNLIAWGKIYGATAATEIFLAQVTKTFILYYLPSQAMQPQLIRIRKVLSDVSMNYINRNDVSKVGKSEGSGRSEYGLTSEISVTQHMSAACRAARSKELKILPSAWLLRQVRTMRNRIQLALPLYRRHILSIVKCLY